MKTTRKLMLLVLVILSILTTGCEIKTTSNGIEIRGEVNGTPVCFPVCHNWLP